jgi:capsular polysaccharide biosynthesis protein
MIKPIILAWRKVLYPSKYEECAVLVGVHGAGLINALGLRPGTSVVELQTKDTTYQYFRNVAALLKDVDYTLFLIHGSGTDKSQEVDMYAEVNDLERLYEIIQTKLERNARLQMGA